MNAHDFFSLTWLTGKETTFTPEDVSKAEALAKDVAKPGEKTELWTAVREAQRQQAILSQPTRPTETDEETESLKGYGSNGFVEAVRAMIPEGLQSKDKRNHLTMVELQYWIQNGNVSPRTHEPAVYLYGEAIKHGKRADFSFVMRYIEMYFAGSRSIKGFGSDQLVRGMAGDKEFKMRHAADIQAPGPTSSAEAAPKEAKKRGGLRLS